MFKVLIKWLPEDELNRGTAVNSKKVEKLFFLSSRHRSLQNAYGRSSPKQSLNLSSSSYHSIMSSTLLFFLRKQEPKFPTVSAT